MYTSLSKLQETVKDREAWHVAVHGVTKNWTCVSDWKTTTNSVWLEYLSTPRMKNKNNFFFLSTPDFFSNYCEHIPRYNFPQIFLQIYLFTILYTCMHTHTHFFLKRKSHKINYIIHSILFLMHFTYVFRSLHINTWRSSSYDKQTHIWTAISGH